MQCQGARRELGWPLDCVCTTAVLRTFTAMARAFVPIQGAAPCQADEAAARSWALTPTSLDGTVATKGFHGRRGGVE